MLCVKCKGKGYCGKQSCPLLNNIYKSKFKEILKYLPEIKNEVFGNSASFLVGRVNYPNVFLSPLVGSFEDAENLYGLKKEEILKIRLNLFSPRIRVNAHRITPLVEKLQEIAMSIKPVDSEVEFYNKPKLLLPFFNDIPPIGPVGNLKRLNYDNPKIPQIVDKVADDYSIEGVLKIYKRFDEVYASRLFSCGVLGKEKKLVPTRWAITAVDDIVGKSFIKKIRDYKVLDEPLKFENHYLGNKFEIYFLPKPWSFKLIETYKSGCIWNKSNKDITVSDSEIKGRKKYANNTGGAYYAARLAVLEKLNKMKRQATVVVKRTVKKDYDIPLGVWVVREGVRKALAKRPLKIAESEIKNLNIQRTLDEYINLNKISD
ncbi:Nre family DNA repair protein [Methanocaldococcus fervens]|uniref:DNA repair protein n=1 Tax=Methanocaldococcus fervens (strain DSM 4213 / JCM 15782 / AG86) TaxID=573064 RepID=C7P806_METFA|nr:Nre family DNA repair protein [Methanocaldococcus fervens]ACV24688.1 Protein of unknown function DUF650 [Methanocaldococcus fervens AG86]